MLKVDIPGGILDEVLHIYFIYNIESNILWKMLSSFLKDIIIYTLSH